MAKGGFVVNWDGKQKRCCNVVADYDEHKIAFHCNDGSGQSEDIKDWSTFSVHAITKKEAEDIVYDKDHRTVKEVKDG